jgi:hypothetical protein
MYQKSRLNTEKKTYYKQQIKYLEFPKIYIGGSVLVGHSEGQKSKIILLNIYKQTKSVNNRKTVKTVMTLTWYRHF